MSVNYLKADLVTELATAIKISKRKTDALLNLLTEIAYREAPGGFTVPGICMLDVVHRKERRARVPNTGQQILIGAHDALRVRPLRKAKNAVTPRRYGLVQPLPPDPVEVAPTAAASFAVDAMATPAEAAPPSPQPPPPGTQPQNLDGLISFRCAGCGQEIEAPEDMSGTQSECPTCGGNIEIPYISEPGTIWGGATSDTFFPPPSSGLQLSSTEPTITEPTEAMKSRTIRIELPDDL